MVALFAFSAVSAQEQGKWGISPKLNLYMNTGDDCIVGIGAAARYSFTDNWRIEPSLTFLCHDYCSIDLHADVHYLFHVANDWTVYPLAGIGVNDFGDWSCGINLGGGFDYSINNHWDVSASLKWMIETHKYWKNPVVLSLGATYKF